MKPFREKIAAFMIGRYGFDQLAKPFIGISIVCLLLSFLIAGNVLNWIGIAFLLLCYLRMFSKNITARSSENQKYLAIKRRLLSRFGRLQKKWKDRKTHRFFTCGQCRQTMRIPKGKGNILVTCPKCGHSFQSKT